MTYLKQQYEQYSSEYLLEQRARGDDISDEAHAAIEQVFRERNEHLPPRPAQPVHIESGAVATERAWMKAGAGVLVLLAGAVAAKMVVNSWLLFPVAVALGVYYLAKHVRRASLLEEARRQEDFEATARSRGMTELMLCAANCDVSRARDLLNFKPDLNARDSSGATALMYAARNGCTELTEMLLAAGADRTLRTAQGSSAKDIALRHGHADLAALL